MTQRILIIGAGFAGMWSALSAARLLDQARKDKTVEVALIARSRSRHSPHERLDTIPAARNPDGLDLVFMRSALSTNGCKASGRLRRDRGSLAEIQHQLSVPSSAPADKHCGTTSWTFATTERIHQDSPYSHSIVPGGLEV